jgi:hypothetical protein
MYFSTPNFFILFFILVVSCGEHQAQIVRLSLHVVKALQYLSIQIVAFFTTTQSFVNISVSTLFLFVVFFILFLIEFASLYTRCGYLLLYPLV